MDVVNLHPLLTLFTIVILLAGLFFLYPVVSLSYSNNVMPLHPPVGNREFNFLPPSLLLFCWLVYSSFTQW